MAKLRERERESGCVLIALVNSRILKRVRECFYTRIDLTHGKLRVMSVFRLLNDIVEHLQDLL